MFTGLFGGELGIRTLEAFRLTAFRVLHLRPLGQLSICQSKNRFQNFWKELTERTTKYSIFEPEKTPDFTGFFSGANSQLFIKFRVLHLRPLGQLSVSIFVRFSFQKFAQKFVGEKTGETAKIFDFEIFCVEEYQGESGGRNSQLPPKFRVRAVMTTSIPVRIF